MAAVWLALDVYLELKGRRVFEVQARTDTVHQAHRGHLNCRCSSLVHCDKCFLFFFVPTRRQWGTANGEIKAPSGENPVLTNVLPLKPGVATTVSSDVGFVFGRCCCRRCCFVLFFWFVFYVCTLTFQRLPRFPLGWWQIASLKMWKQRVTQYIWKTFIRRLKYANFHQKSRLSKLSFRVFSVVSGCCNLNM